MINPDEIPPPNGYVPWMARLRHLLCSKRAKLIVTVVFYVVFIVAGTQYVRGMINYHNIDSWPSVEAEVVGTGGNLVSVPTQSKYGGSSSYRVDTRFVVFRYSVEGRLYTSKTATPDGGGLPMNPMNQPWRAYYNPSSPDVAVLDPANFRGIGSLVAAVFSGIIVLPHLWFTIVHLFTRSQPAKQ